MFVVEITNNKHQIAIAKAFSIQLSARNLYTKILIADG